MGVKGLTDRWLRARRALKREEQPYADRLIDMAKKHSSEGFYAFDEPLEAAVFSALIEILKEMDKEDVDP